MPLCPYAAAILAHLVKGHRKCITLCVRRKALQGVLPAGPIVTAATLESLLSLETNDDQWRIWGDDPLPNSVSTAELLDCVDAGWSVRSIRVIRSSGQMYTISAPSPSG